MLYRALMGESCSPTGKECFVTWKIGEMLRRFTGKGNCGDAETSVFGGLVVGISLSELGAEVLDLLLGRFERALGLFVYLLLTGECFCTFCTP